MPTSIHSYQFDGLGSAIALTNSSGSVVNLYEYSVYGELSASDPNHPNRFLFTGREFDKDTGLYYYRARYYNPYIGRFLQTDPIGYGDGMNWYNYCGNNSVNRADPSGLWFRFLDPEEVGDAQYAVKGRLTFAWIDAGTVTSSVTVIKDFGSLDEWISWARGGGDGRFDEAWKQNQPGYNLAAGSEDVFWGLQALRFLKSEMDLLIRNAESSGCVTIVQNATYTRVGYDYFRWSQTGITIWWNPHWGQRFSDEPVANPAHQWHNLGHLIVGLAHELSHVDDWLGAKNSGDWEGRMALENTEATAMCYENSVRYRLFTADPACSELYPRPGYQPWHPDIAGSACEAWKKYNRGRGREQPWPYYP